MVEEDLPDHHFSDTDLQSEWKAFLDELSKQDIVTYNAISDFQLKKESESSIIITYPSESAKAEFEKIQADFFNHFKKKVNNYKIDIQYKIDVGMKKEILTKRKIFDKFAEINPVLRDLDNLMKFDLG